MAKIKIFDTTLRDGEQTPGVNLNLNEKLLIARQLEALNVDVIEAGFPIASKGDFEAVQTIAKEIKGSTVAGLCRAKKEDIDVAFDAIKNAAKPRLHLFLATSPIHMQYKLNMSCDEVYDRAVEMVSYAKSLCEDIEFSAEDASRSDKDFLCKLFEGVIKSGATVLNIPDTVGYSTPQEFYNFIKYIKENTKGIENVDISVHCHDDLGLAVANSLAGIDAGATQVECAMNGLGERAGNAALEEIVMAIKTRSDVIKHSTNINAENIYRTSKLVSSLTGVNVQPNKAIIGSNAFSHESGVHQDGFLKERSTYEIMRPETIGIKNNKEIVLGKHSGRHAFDSYLVDNGINLSKDQLDEAFSRFKLLTDKKKTITPLDIEAIVNSNVTINELYKLKSFQINSGNKMMCTAALEVEFGDETIREVGIGAGSVEAAVEAIERITKYSLELKDYNIQSVTSGEDAIGEVTVKIKSNDKIYIGRSISQDIMEASINAFLNGINKAEEDK